MEVAVELYRKMSLKRKMTQFVPNNEPEEEEEVEELDDENGWVETDGKSGTIC